MRKTMLFVVAMTTFCGSGAVFADENWQCRQIGEKDFQCYNGGREYACRTEYHQGEAGDNVIRLDLAPPYACPVACSVVSTAPPVIGNGLSIGGGWTKTAQEVPSVLPVGHKKNSGPRNYDMSVFGGRRVGGGGERGQYSGFSAEWRGAETEWLGKKVQIGPFVDYSTWKGKTADGYRYNGDSVAVGPSAKMFGDGWDVNAKVGIGSAVNKGKISQYENRQIDRTVIGSIGYTDYSRRNAGEQWLPEWNAGVFGTASLNADREDSWAGRRLGNRPDNINTFGARAGMDIINIPLGDSELSVAPGVNYDIRHSSQVDSAGKHWADSFGPGVVLRDKNVGSLGSVGVMFDDLGGVAVGGSVQVGAILQAYRASQITAVPVGVSQSANTTSSAASGSWFPTDALVYGGGGWHPTN